MDIKQKKILRMASFTLCTLLFFQFVIIKPSIAFSNTTPKLTYVINGIPRVGNTIDITVNISNGADIYGSSLDFIYDNSALQVLSIEKGNLYSNASPLVPVKKINDGQANIAATLTGNQKPLSGNGSLFVIKAKVLKGGVLNFKTTNSNSNLSLSGATCRVKLSNNNGEKINYSAVDASVQLINGPYNPSLSANMASPQSVNSSIRISSSANGTGNLSYRFWITNGTSRNLVQDFSSKNYYDWIPSKPGVYRLSVDIKDSSNNYATEEIVYTITN